MVGPRAVAVPSAGLVAPPEIGDPALAWMGSQELVEGNGDGARQEVPEPRQRHTLAPAEVAAPQVQDAPYRLGSVGLRRRAAGEAEHE